MEHGLKRRPRQLSSTVRIGGPVVQYDTKSGSTLLFYRDPTSSCVLLETISIPKKQRCAGADGDVEDEPDDQ